MGLDVRIIQRRKILCPNCGEVVCHKDIECVDSGGRAWYDILESFGYYVPYEQRTEENDWYCVSKHTIQDAVTGKHWAHVVMPEPPKDDARTRTCQKGWLI